MQVLARRKRIADLEVPVVGQTHDIPRKRFLHHLFFLSHKSRGRGELHHPVEPHVLVIHVAFKLARTHLHESDTRTVVGIHVGMNLENKSRETLFIGIHHPLFGLHLTGRRGDIHKTVEQLLHPEIIQSRTKEYRSQTSRKVLVTVECRIHLRNQFHVVAQLLREAFADLLFQFGRLNVEPQRFRHRLLARLVKVEAVGIQVIHPFKPFAHVDRPTQGAHAYFQFLFQLVEDFERIPSFTVEFIHKNHHRRMPHAAHLHQFARLRFHPFGRVNHHDHAIHRRKRAVRILGKILVAGSIQNIYFMFVVFKAHHRRGHRYSALFLDLHPVGRGSFLYLVRFNGTRHMDSPPKEKQFLRKGCFSRIGVADHGKRAPALYFFFYRHLFVLVSLR